MAFTPAYARLADPGASGHFSVSASSLTIGALELQVNTTAYSITWVAGELNSDSHTVW